MKPITDPSDIDLNKHGVIEASAGTGKTYTLENLVVRLLIEENIPIESILLVTFTEKATGEMSQRIRANLENAIEAQTHTPEERERLQTALDQFDTASIQTIHGFCQKTLRLHALENGIPFETEVVEDLPLYESSLYELMRAGWRQKYEESFESLLRLSGFEGSLKDRSDWRSHLLKVARDWQPTLGDRLIPEPPADLKQFALDLGSEFERHLETIRQLAGPMGDSDVREHPLSVGFSKLNINARTRNALLEKVLHPLLRFIARSEKERVTWGDFQELIGEAQSYSAFKTNGSTFETLIPSKWLQAGDNLEEVCPTLRPLVVALEGLRRLQPGKRVFAGFVRDLREEVDRNKSDRGQISFNDMILRLYVALQPETPSSERFLDELR
ncbi:MAG: UvrD-helicase domain-containing protein, partial [Candidatus Omnitrophica bacterium]|nr:UvrD-helicase domain-containing protein [Candidatus Omnitrophota bacterium]